MNVVSRLFTSISHQHFTRAFSARNAPIKSCKTASTRCYHSIRATKQRQARGKTLYKESLKCTWSTWHDAAAGAASALGVETRAITASCGARSASGQRYSSSSSSSSSSSGDGGGSRARREREDEDSKDFYALLGVERTATDKEIKKSYYALAQRLHPDKSDSEEDAAQFRRIQRAYDVLKDKEQRRLYDGLGHEQFERYSTTGSADGGGPGGGGAGNPFQGGGGFQYRYGAGQQEDMENIFEQFFGMRFQQVVDVPVTIGVTFRESISGVEREISFKDPFDGSAQKLKVRLPGLLDDGQQFTMGYESKSSRTNSRGEEQQQRARLVVRVSVAPDPRLTRKGLHIVASVDVDIVDAVLGCNVTVPTLSGDIALRIPPGTQYDTRFTISNGGALDEQSRLRGNQYVFVKFEVPRFVNETQKRLLKEFREAAHRPGASTRSTSATASSSAVAEDMEKKEQSSSSNDNPNEGSSDTASSTATTRDDHDDGNDDRKAAK